MNPVRKTQSLSITLPHEMAQMVKDKVASGAYATESEVIREGLRALQTQDAAVEDWLRTEGVARYDAWHREPRGRPAAEVFAGLRKHHQKRAKTGRR
jgi:putative addiction module CopG family antidote